MTKDLMPIEEMIDNIRLFVSEFDITANETFPDRVEFWEAELHWKGNPSPTSPNIYHKALTFRDLIVELHDMVQSDIREVKSLVR